MGWAIDLDGVMWLGDEPIAGSAAAIGRLRAAGVAVLFVTNNSSAPVAEVEQKLADMGVEASGAVVTSAMAGATLVHPGERAFACAGPGVVEALQDRGVVVLDDPDACGSTDVDAVVVGFTRSFDFERLSAATLAVRNGARLIATNDDATYPTPDGQLPGGGAILAAVVTASGVQPVVAGKPHDPMVELVRGRLGGDGTMIGDRPETDGRFAVALGYRFGLVHTGVTGSDAQLIDPAPDLVAADLATLVERALGEATV
ncbi:MAG: HAD-IIA family hydrolase [Acidimicrobiales bacterium]